MYPRPGIQYVDQTQPQMGIKGRPVSSIEEARAISIDFDGSVFYFPDLANRRIYTKQINMDGTASLNVYELKNEPVVSSPQYVTREEFETTLAQLKQAMLGKEPESQSAPAQPQQTEKFKFQGDMNYEPNATYPNAQEWTESLATRYESARKLDG